METYSQEFAQASESGELMKDRLQLIEHRAGDKVYKDRIGNLSLTHE
jgi:hypothetical protein